MVLMTKRGTLFTWATFRRLIPSDCVRLMDAQAPPGTRRDGDGSLKPVQEVVPPVESRLQLGLAKPLHAGPTARRVVRGSLHLPRIFLQVG